MLARKSFSERSCTSDSDCTVSISSLDRGGELRPSGPFDADQGGPKPPQTVSQDNDAMSFFDANRSCLQPQVCSLKLALTYDTLCVQQLTARFASSVVHQTHGDATAGTWMTAGHGLPLPMEMQDEPLVLTVGTTCHCESPCLDVVVKLQDALLPYCWQWCLLSGFSEGSSGHFRHIPILHQQLLQCEGPRLLELLPA